MREIKFRVWDKDFNKIHVCDEDNHDSITFLNNEACYYNLQNGCGSLPKELGEGTYEMMQYTGLKDKNGVEIYEGDVVRITGEQEFDVGYSCEMKDNAVVKWDEKECGFFLDVIKKRTVNFSDFEGISIDVFSLRHWDEEEWWIEYEVIGNIHENPHLLEGKL